MAKIVPFPPCRRLWREWLGVDASLWRHTYASQKYNTNALSTR